MHVSSRRTFLTQSLATTGVLILSGRSRRALGANDRIRVAVAGINGRGKSHVGAFSGMEGVEVAYLVDPDTRTFAANVKTVESAGGNTPQCVQDIRRVLDDKNVDVVSIATPNHWHSLMTIWACQAGKDVYVEKPCSHNLHEGRMAVETARKHNRIVQHGTQRRASGLGDRIQALAKSGKLGKLRVSRALCYKLRASIGVKDMAPPPTEVDFNLWLGPAPQQQHHANLVHYNWHWFWDFGNGDIGNQGVHEMDAARWGIAGATLPRSVISLGGRFGYQDQGQTPNTQLALFDFGETQLIFEVRGLNTEPLYGQKVGILYHFDEGVVAGDKFFPKGKTEGEKVPEVDTGVPERPGGEIFKNFIAAVRSRKQSDLYADILEGHYSSALCHLANMSYRLAEEVPFNERTKAFGDNKDAYESLERMQQHLRDGNNVAIDGMKYKLGKKLMIDTQRERIRGDESANRLLTRDYRAPFVVPERV